jgi:hypothetical protein
MAMSDGLGSMLGAGGAEGGLSYLPYVGKAYQAYKAIKGFRKGGVKGAVKSVVPFGGSMFGSKGSRTNKMARQYMGVVTDFENKFLAPTIKNIRESRRGIIKGAGRGNIRVGGETIDNILATFEKAGHDLKERVGRSDFGSISKRITELSGLSEKLEKAIGRGGRGGGPSRISIGGTGAQKLPLPRLSGEAPAINLPSGESDRLYGGSYNPTRSESHRFPVKTTRTPGKTGNLNSILKPGGSPGILT